MAEIEHVTFAAGSGHLDRASHLRDIADDLLRHRRAALLPVFHGRLLIDLESSEPRLGWVPPLEDYLTEATDEPVFLGLSADTPCFAADFSAMEDEAARERFCDGADFVDLRAIAGQLGPASAAIGATAKSLIHWHQSNQFCPRCSARSVLENGGWRRGCPECGAVHFPRTDPIVIMLILLDDQALVARQTVWPNGLYSLLAGFVEPGETLEDAVRREAKKETGVEVGRVSYLGCQPWPFPGSLMIGCIGEAETRDISVNPGNLEDAQWVSRAKMQVILEGKHPRMSAPAKDAISRAILDDWAADAIDVP